MTARLMSGSNLQRLLLQRVCAAAAGGGGGGRRVHFEKWKLHT